jgi:3-(3-hydroxy-phenyl)propionate hydroxylase
MTAYDVAVIGLGPVGCTAAIMFASSGLKVVAIERDEEVYQLPRAVGMDGEIIRGFQRFGMGEDIDALMVQVEPGDRWGFANSRREWLFGQEFSSFGSNGWQPMNGFDQPQVEQLLRSRALAHANVTAHIGCSATSVENTEGGVEVGVVNDVTGAKFVVDARYAVACDGASSSVRKQLGIEWRDLGYNHDWLVVDAITDDRHGENNEILQICDPDRIITYGRMYPFLRWEFKMNEGETREEMLREDTIASLIAPFIPNGVNYTIRRTAVYTFHAATAGTWRVGNIFIAGDAAHQTPPFLGQGMNAGMRDIINLSWKLPLVLSGVASDSLLDTYQQERDGHAHELVDWAVAVGKLLEHLAQVELAEREGREPPEASPDLLASGYGQGREQPPLRGGAICIEQQSDGDSTGYLFSQPIVKNQDGVEFKLDEILGRGFAIVGKSAEVLELSGASKRIVDLLGAKLVALDGIDAVRGEFDPLFENCEVAIVRPDRIVFGHTTDELALDQLVADLASRLSLNLAAEQNVS